MNILDAIVLARNMYENIDSYMPKDFLYQSNTIKSVIVRDDYTDFFKIECYNTDIGQTREEVITSHIDKLPADYDNAVVEVGYGYLKVGAIGNTGLIIVSSIDRVTERPNVREIL